MPAKEDILTGLREHMDELRALGVKSLAVFGSVARGEASEESDVDLLVEFNGPPTFDGYMDTKFFLEDLFGRRIDLVLHDDIKPRIRDRVEKEAVYVA